MVDEGIKGIKRGEMYLIKLELNMEGNIFNGASVMYINVMKKNDREKNWIFIRLETLAKWIK
jgi:hypothetical protein